MEPGKHLQVRLTGLLQREAINAMWQFWSRMKLELTLNVCILGLMAPHNFFFLLSIHFL